MFNFNIVWTFLIALTSVAIMATEKKLAANIGRTTPIVNGPKITIEQAPYMVELRSRYEVLPMHWCAGTLVSSKFVVTAAHCFDYMFKEEFVVVGGVSQTSERGEQRFIEKVFIHPEYKHHTVDKDVAVVKLTHEMTGKYSQPIPLCQKPLDENSKLQVSGWGRRVEKSSEHLRSVTVPVIDQAVCAERHIDSGWKINDDMICAASQGGGKCTCSGDSGGPGVMDDSLCAIVSWGMGSISQDYPGVYVRIDAVRDFIEESMKK